MIVKRNWKSSLFFLPLLVLSACLSSNISGLKQTPIPVDDFIPVTLTNNDDAGRGFSIKSAQIESSSLKGTVFFMDKINAGQSKSLDVSGILSNREYNHLIACSARCEVNVVKGKNGKFYNDGVRKLENGGKYLLAGFVNPNFDSLKLQVVSKDNNNIVTAGIFQDSKVKPGSFISEAESTKIYGTVGSNTEVFSLPTTLKYLGTTPVTKATINRKAFPKIALLLAAFSSIGAFDKNNSYQGAFNKRYIYNTTIWSNHSWGAAIDLITNKSDGSALKYSETATFVTPQMKDIASRLGIAWGGFWQKSYDPMHWECINNKM